MNKLYLLFFTALTFLISGCTKQTALANFNYNNFYGNSLQYTFKNDIVTNNDVTAMLNATYLNSVDKNLHSGITEVFLVGIFIENDIKNENKTFEKEYTLTLNNNKPVSIKELNENDKMYAKMPLFNPWAKYFIVEFSKESLNKDFLKKLTKKEKYVKFEYQKIKLKLSKNKDEFTELEFQKEI